MNWLSDFALWQRLRPRVAHRLPGRLRLQIPLLRHLPDEWLDLTALLEQVVASPAAISNVRSNRRSGSIVVTYDPDQLHEDDVMTYLRALFELLRRHRHRLGTIPPERASCVAHKLNHWLRDHIRHCPEIDPDTVIPDAIWN